MANEEKANGKEKQVHIYNKEEKGISEWSKKDRNILTGELLNNAKSGHPSLLDLSVKYGVPVGTISRWKAQILKEAADTAGSESAFDRLIRERKARQRRQVRRYVILTGVCVAAGITAFIAHAAWRAYRKPVDVMSYIKVSCTGIDGYGSCKADFDNDAFSKAYGVNMDSDAVAAEVSPDSGVSNGDPVKVSLDFSEALDKARLRPASSERTETASGLSKGKKVDVFQDVAVSFSGLSGEGKAAVENKSDDPLVKQCKFTFDKNTGLTEGDTVTLTCAVPDGAIESAQEVPTGLTKTYTVQSLSKYAGTEVSTDAIRGLADKEKSALELALSKGGITSDGDHHDLWIERRIGKDAVSYMDIDDADSESFASDELAHAYLVSNGDKTLAIQSKYTGFLENTQGSEKSDGTSDSITKNTNWHNLLIMTFAVQMQWQGEGSRYPITTRTGYYTAIYSDVIINPDGTADTDSAKKLYDDYESEDVHFDENSAYAAYVKPLENNTVTELK